MNAEFSDESKCSEEQILASAANPLRGLRQMDKKVDAPESLRHPLTEFLTAVRDWPPRFAFSPGTDQKLGFQHLDPK